MSGNASRIFVAQMARVWLAPVGTIAPTDPVIAMPVGWFDVGLFTPDSLGFSTDPTFEETTSHQSNFPTRKWQTGDSASAEVDLQEWSVDNFRSVYGGGTVTEIEVDTKTYYRFSPPAVGSRTDVAACIELIDGAKHLRRVIPRASQDEGVSQSFNKTAESTLPLRLSVLGADLGDPWYDLSDLESFAPAV